jgi:hypothetical protein
VPTLITTDRPPAPTGGAPSLTDEFAYWTVTPALGSALTGWPIASAILGSGAAVAFEWAACLVLLGTVLGVLFRGPLGRRRLPWQHRTS